MLPLQFCSSAILPDSLQLLFAILNLLWHALLGCLSMDKRTREMNGNKKNLVGFRTHERQDHGQKLWLPRNLSNRDQLKPCADLLWPWIRSQLELLLKSKSCSSALENKSINSKFVSNWWLIGLITILGTFSIEIPSIRTSCQKA